MRSTSIVLATILCGTALVRISVAELIGIVPGFPVLVYDNQGVTVYDADTGLFAIDATPLVIRFDPTEIPRTVGPTGVLQSRFLQIRVQVDEDGNLIGGDPNTPGDTDLVIEGEVDADGDGIPNYDGVLLTGAVLEFGFDDSGGSTDEYDFRFRVTGGSLASLYGYSDIGVVVTSEQSDFQGDFGVDFTGEAKGVVGPTEPLPGECELEVTVEGCIVTPPAPPAGGQCDKPIEELTMIWDGDQPVRVKAWKGPVDDSELLADVDNIAIGDELAIAGYAGSPNDVYWEIFVAGTDDKIGESRFHVSCSDAEMNGPEDCGNREGNGKGNEADLINDWLLEGIVHEGGTLDCTADDGDGDDDDGECMTEFELNGPSCPDGDKVLAVQLRYTGDDCDATYHTQDPNKVSCDGDPMDAMPVGVMASDKGNPDDDRAKVWFDGVVELDEVFEVSAANAGENHLKADTWVHVFDSVSGALLQTVKFHTSCSQPLNLGDQFGSLLVFGLGTEDDGAGSLGVEVEYTYKIENIGPVDTTDVEVVDDLPGDVPGSPIPVVGAGETVVITRTAMVELTTTNTVYVMGHAGVNTCEATDSTAITLLPPPLPECIVRSKGASRIDRKKVEWTLSNDGDDKITIESIDFVWPDSNGNLKKVKLGRKTIFDEVTAPPGVFVDVFDGSLKDREIKPGKNGKLKFEFEHNAYDHESAYSILVTFAGGCSVEFIPGVGGDYDCDKPIAELTMIWDGDQTVRVKAWKGRVNDSDLLADVDHIAIGDELAIAGYAGSPNDVYWEIFVAGTDDKIGESTFHVSCSDSEMNGPEDCGIREGNGKNNEVGLINDWLLEGIVDEDGVLDCMP